jgi:micrococcal nuclease
MSPLLVGMSHQLKPRRRLLSAVVMVIAALVALRIWQLSLDRAPEKLDEGEHRVARVIDGDTLMLTNGARVRLIGIDSPETQYSRRSEGKDQPLAREAAQFAQRAVEGRHVRLQLDKERIDKYGRFLAYIWYVDRESSEELMLNEELIRAGLARALLRYSYSEKMKRRFRAAEQEARQAGRGIWARDTGWQSREAA